jgi:sarcosine oxidase subunit alpha
MSGQPFRLASGGLLDRDRPLSFAFNGRTYSGYAGDTLASALLANGVRLVGRSFKYHRPRGIVSSGIEEPNAWVQLGAGGREDPNMPATVVELYDGLIARSPDCWPSVDFDLGAATGLLSRLFVAGFYNKTFMRPARLWPFYERMIRRLAGVGTAPAAPDPETYEECHAKTDVLVVGAGPAGLCAALAAARAGARVILADEQPRWGGSLLSAREEIDGKPGLDWVETAVAELSATARVRLLPRTTVFGCYDHNFVAALERRTDHLAPDKRSGPRQRLWQIRAGQVVLATGAHERPLVFANNDRPGVMLASAARTYVNGLGGSDLCQPLWRAPGGPRGGVHEQRQRLAGGLGSGGGRYRGRGARRRPRRRRGRACGARPRGRDRDPGCFGRCRGARRQVCARRRCGPD